MWTVPVEKSQLRKTSASLLCFEFTINRRGLKEDGLVLSYLIGSNFILVQEPLRVDFDVWRPSQGNPLTGELYRGSHVSNMIRDLGPDHQIKKFLPRDTKGIVDALSDGWIIRGGDEEFWIPDLLLRIETEVV